MMKNFWTLYIFNYKNFMKMKVLRISIVMLLLGVGGSLYFNGRGNEGSTTDLYVHNTTNVASSLLKERLNTFNEQAGSKDTYEFKTINNEESNYPQVFITESAGIYNLQFVYDDANDMNRRMEEQMSATFKTFVQTQPDNVNVNRTFNHTEGVTLYIVSYVTMFISYTLIALLSANLMQSIMTEKLQKIMEVLAYKAKPTTLVFSKLFAMLTIGLQMLLLVVLEIFAFIQFDIISRDWVDQLLTSLNMDLGVGALIIFFVMLGCFFYMLLYAMCAVFVTSEQQASTAPLPVTIVMMLSIWFAMYAFSDMHGPLLKYSIYVPILSPMTLPAVVFSGRYEYWELMLVAAVFAAFIGLAVWIINKVILPRKMS